MAERTSFEEATASYAAEVAGGVAPEDFERPGELSELIAQCPRVNVPVASFRFFPAAAKTDTPLPERCFLLAEGDTRSIVVLEDGEILETHFAGSRPLPFSLAEILSMAAPLVDLDEREIAGARFVPPDAEQELRSTLGNDFDATMDLFGVPLLAGVRAELDGRIRGAHITMGVAVALMLGAALVALAIEGVAMKLIAAILLGCVPLAILTLGYRSGARAKAALRELPS